MVIDDKKQITIVAPDKTDREYLDDPTVRFEWFPRDISKDPRQDAEELGKKIDEFLQDKEHVSVEYMSVRKSGKLIGGGFAVYYRTNT